MKKRLLSALLALALVFVLLPTTALADTTPVTDENVKINGTPVTVGNGISLGEGNGTYSYDKSTRTLTLNNATITATGSNIGIDFCDTTNYVTYSVILTGENTVTSNDIAIETTSNTNLTFTGGGNLKAITKGNQHQAIRVYGTLTIDNSTLIAESSAYTATTVIWTLAMTGNNAKLEISNKSAANIVAGTAGPASKNIDWSNYQFTTGSYSGDALTERDPEVCSWGTLNEYLGFPTKKYSQYICIAKRTIPALQRTSDVFIAGEKAVVSQWTNIPADTGTGSYSYDADKKELTLKDVTITSGTNAIQFAAAGTYTVNLEGTNKISNVSTGISAASANPNFTGNINVILSGSGSLDISARGRAIEVPSGNLTFNNTGTINLKTANTASSSINAIKVSGDISVGSDFNKNLKITTDNGDFMLGVSDLKSLNECKTITIAPKPSEAYYNNTAMKYGETKPAGNGTISCDENGVITLNGVTEGTLEFRSSSDSTLALEGTNTLSSIVTTQKGLTISGSGSLTVGSIKVTNDTRYTGNLTITDGAKVTAGTTTSDAKAIDITGDLTVTNGSLKATSTSDSVPTVQVGGNASFTGSTVTITNHSDRQGKSGEYSYAVSTGLYVGGTLDIKNAAKVTSTVIGGNAIYAKGDITISGDNTEVKATNDAYKFSAISTNKTVNISDNSTVKAENLKKHRGDPTGDTDPSTGKTYNPCPAIAGKIANKNSQNKLHIVGFITSSAGSQNPTEGTPLYLDIAPSSVEPYIHHYKVTITRGDEVARTESPVVIAGTTLLNDTYYTINGSTVAEGTASNYNAFYDSTTKTLKLNNAQISTTTNNAAIKIREDLTIKVTGTNELKGNYNHCIESYNNFTINGTGTLNMTNTSSSSSAASVIYCGPYKNLTIAAEVIIKNEAKPGNLIFTVEKDAYSFAEGYNVYASTDVSGSPLEAYDAAKGSTYKYLRVTKENLAPTTPTTYTVTITGENISKYYSSEGELEQTVTAGEAIKTVTVAANGGYYFPDNYVKDLELPSGITATVSGDNWYLTIKGIPSKDATINLPVLSKRPTITVDIPLPVAGNKPATIDQIHLTCDDPNYTPEITGIRWNKGSLTEESVAIGANDTFVAGTCYNVKIFLSSGIADGAYKLAYAGGGDNPWYAYWGTSNFQLYFQATPAATHTHEKGDLQFNSEGHWYKCAADTSCTERIDFASHTYKDNICTVCNYVKPACSHTNLKYIDNNDYETHKVQCADCEEIIAEKEAHDIQGYVIDDVAGTHQEFCNKCHYRGLALHHSIIYVPKDNGHCKACAICKVQLGRVEEHTFENGVCTVCNATSGEIEPPTPDNPGTIVIIRPAEEEKPAQQPNPSTGANDLVGLAVAAAVAAALGSAALLRKHD